VKVLVTGFEWFGDLVPFVVRALSGLATSVAVVPTNTDVLIRHRAASLDSLEAIPLVGHSAAGRWRSKLARDGDREVNDAFRREVERFKPDVVLSILCWGEPLTSDSLACASGATRIGWLMDDPFGYEGSRLENLLTSFDRLYSPDDGWSDNIERMTGRRPDWLPCGADPESHHPVDASRQESELAGHVVYVGSSCVGHPAGAFRRALLESLEGVPLAIFGDTGWKSLGGSFARSYRGGPVSSERANVIYGSGAIALNFHHPQFRRGTSLRTFALCGAGAFQVVDWRDGLDRWLTPGVELVTFRTPAELRGIVDRYLAEPAERARIAAAGRTRVLAEHTYRHRLQTMFSHVR
jgi:spore maturation protein CgeB